MEVLAQSVRASDCGSEGRGFEPHIPPLIIPLEMFFEGNFCFLGITLNLLPFPFVLQYVFNLQILG